MDGSSDRSNSKQTFFNFPALPPFFIYLSEQIWNQMTLNFKGFECSLSFTFWERIGQFNIFSFSPACECCWRFGHRFSHFSPTYVVVFGRTGSSWKTWQNRTLADNETKMLVGWDAINNPFASQRPALSPHKIVGAPNASLHIRK